MRGDRRARTVPRGPHFVQLYGADAELLTTNVCAYLSEGLARGECVAVIATPEHCAAFSRGVEKLGVDVAAAEAEGRAVFADAAGTLARFMVDGRPNRMLFERTIGGLTSLFPKDAQVR